MGINQIDEWREGNELCSKFWKNNSMNSSPKLSEMVEGISMDGLDLISQMLHLNPHKRIGLKKVLKHSFFTGKQTKTSNNSFDTNFIRKIDQFDSKRDEKKYSKIVSKPKRNKEVIKKNLISKFREMNKLNLSKVNETDNESSVDLTPTRFKIEAPLKPKKKSKFEKHFTFFNNEREERNKSEQKVFNNLHYRSRSRGISVNLKSNTSSNEKAAILSLPKISSSLNSNTIYPAFMNSSKEERTVQKYSPMNSINVLNNSNILSPQNSSSDELELLKRRVEDQKMTSMPINLKNCPIMTSRSNIHSTSLSMSRGV